MTSPGYRLQGFSTRRTTLQTRLTAEFYVLCLSASQSVSARSISTSTGAFGGNRGDPPRVRWDRSAASSSAPSLTPFRSSSSTTRPSNTAMVSRMPWLSHATYSPFSTSTASGQADASATVLNAQTLRSSSSNKMIGAVNLAYPRSV